MVEAIIIIITSQNLGMLTTQDCRLRPSLFNLLKNEARGRKFAVVIIHASLKSDSTIISSLI